MKPDNLLLVAGSGRNSGKTTIVCKLIGQFSNLGVTSIKISPHFHNPSEGLIHFSGKPGFEIYEETNRDTSKDSSRMLQSGAEKVYYIQTIEKKIDEAFSAVYMNIGRGKPLICESPALINYIKPGLFIIMISESGGNQKGIDDLRKFPHIEYSYEDILKI
ncbi:MAG: hypothetical protein C0408_06975, partial [Odoribacter sp.]|nr:hypothetical protein [Odoribacter sp.]